ncbi:MAG: hypothetical protein EZS28_049869, partial [Streblomastix strix]
MNGVQANEIDFWATNILDEQNGEARRREIQCPSLLPVTSVPVPDEVLVAKRSPIDMILQSVQALALYDFRIGEGMLAHLCKQQEENLAIDQLSQMTHNLREAERTHFARAIANAGSTGHCQKRHGVQRRDRNYEFAVRNPIARKGKGQDQEDPSISAISDLKTGDETNAEPEREPSLGTKPRNLTQKNTRLYASSRPRTARLASARTWTVRTEKRRNIRVN